MRFQFPDRFSGTHEFSPVFKEAHTKAEQVFAAKEIKMDDFKHLYGAEAVEADKERLRLTKERFKTGEEEREIKKVADVFEAVILDKGETCGWLGNNAKLIKTTEYDDVFSGIDSVVQYNLGGGFESNLGLAIDVTFGQGVEKKLERICERIQAGTLGRIKYFASGNFRGEKINIPHIVVGADKLVVEGLAKLWVDPDRQRHLVNHPVQYQMPDMALRQAEVFSDFAESRGQPEIAEAYKHIVSVLKAVHKQKHLNSNLDIGDRDRVFESVMRFMDSVY